MRHEIKLAQVLQRELKNRVVSQVAKEVGMSISLLHDWHRSARKPSASNMGRLKRLADYLGLSLEEILFDENSGRQVVSSSSFFDRGVQYRINIEKVKE